MENKNKKRLVILGGGLSGLAAGEILSKHFEVTLLEDAPFLGGLAANFEHNGKSIPRYYHHIIKSNKTTQKYLWEFGKVPQLKWKKIKVAIGINGRLHNVNEPLGLLNFNYLNLYEKLRFGLFGLYTLFLMNPNKIPEGQDAQSWLERFAGKAVTDKIFYHLYSRNKFNLPLSKISARQFAHRLHEKEIYDYFAFPEGGYQSMIDDLEKVVMQRGGKIKKNTKISQINLSKKYVMEQGKKIPYDLLLSSLPFEVFLKITKGIPNNIHTQLSQIKYCPAVGLCFATEEFLEPKNYWLNLFNERIHVLIQHSLLQDSYGEKEKINWCLRYGGSEEDLKLSDKEIKQKYLGVVRKYFPKAKIKWAKVMRTKYAEPLYDINYHQYLPNYSSPIKGLYFTGIQLTYPRIRNMNAALDSGREAAKVILERELTTQTNGN